MAQDNITVARIAMMHPDFRNDLLKQYLEINNTLPRGVRLRFTDTLRTFEEQTALYNKGRKTSGKIVTNAKAGDSFHNYGLAFDIVILYDKDGDGNFETASYDIYDKNYLKVVNFFKNNGWRWGGDFRSFKDYPHFECQLWKLERLKQFKKDKQDYPILQQF